MNHGLPSKPVDERPSEFTASTGYSDLLPGAFALAKRVPLRRG